MNPTLENTLQRLFEDKNHCCKPLRSDLDYKGCTQTKGCFKIFQQVPFGNRNEPRGSEGQCFHSPLCPSGGLRNGRLSAGSPAGPPTQSEHHAGK